MMTMRRRGVIVQFSFVIIYVFVVVQRDRRDFQRCSTPPYYVCIVDSPFTQVGGDGILNVTVNGSNIVGQESTIFLLHLNDIGL